MTRAHVARIVLVVVILAASGWLTAAVTAAPLATTATNWSGVSIDLMSVERKGSVLTVKWLVKNQGSQDAQVSFPLTGEAVTTYVLDEESGTKYYALTDKEKNVLASQSVYVGSGSHGIQERIPAGESRRYWAKFPAPPPAVKTINVLFTSSEPLEGVSIAEK